MKELHRAMCSFKQEVDLPTGHEIEVAHCISGIQLQFYVRWCTCMQLANNIPQLGLSFPVACASLSGQQKQAPACRVLGNTVALDCAFPSPNTSLCWQQGKCQSLLQWNALTAAGSNVGSLAFWAFSSYKVKSYRYDPATKFKDSCYQNAGFGWSRWNAQQRWNIISLVLLFAHLFEILVSSQLVALLLKTAV